MPESNLARVATWLAEEERRKRQQAEELALPEEDNTDRVFANTKTGVQSYLQTANSLMDGGEVDDPTGEVARDLRERGYRWLAQDDYAQALSNAQQGADGAFRPPPGKLPFISGTPTHAATKPAFSYIPPRKPTMEEAMSGAAGLARPSTAPAAPAPAAKPSPKATLAKARRSREVSVRSTQEGVQPQLRAPLDPLAARGAAPTLPPRVSSFLQGRRQPSGLEDAQRRANVNQFSANLAQSAEYLGAGVGGVRPRPEAYSNLQEQAGQPVEQYQQRAAEERQQEQDELALAEAEREAARAAEEMQFRKSRATSEDQLARDRMAQDERLAGKRLEGDAADRALRRQEMRQRREDDLMMKALMADEKDQAKREREDELDLQRLGAATSKGPFGEMQESLESVNRLVPGLAYGQVPDELPLGTWDRIMRVLEPIGGEALMTDKGKEYATLIANLRDLVSRKRSGAVLNEGEERHYLKLLGDRVFSDPRSAATGINEVRKGLGRTLRNVQGGFSPGALNKYEATGATSYRAPIFGAAPTGEEIQMPNGDVYEVLQDGTTRRRP